MGASIQQKLDAIKSEIIQLDVARRFMIDEHKKVSNQLIVAEAKIKKLEDEILECPCSDYHKK